MAYIGGIVGSINEGKIENCSFSGSLSISDGGGRAGGIAGIATNVTVRNCNNTGSISSSYPDGVALGGIISSARECYVSNCNNTAKIDCRYGYNIAIGGIVAFSTGTISNCYNIGNSIVNDTEYVEVGGIVGDGDIVNNCYNAGTIKTSPIYEECYVGGIAGICNNVSNCYNIGSLENHVYARGYSFSRAFAGGIVGRCITIDNCYNIGEVKNGASDYDFTGGIAGKCFETTSNCYNSGNIDASGEWSHTGGIDGEAKKIENCYNVGSVKTYSYSGGDSIEMSGLGGGIAGVCNVVTDCYNKGNLVGEQAGTVGNIVGCESEVNDCYYFDTVTVSRERYVNKHDDGIKITNDAIEGTKLSIILNSDYLKTEDAYNELNVDGVWEYVDKDYPILKEGIIIDSEIESKTELEIQNTIKKFKITTDVKENDGIKGGSITGEDNDEFEIVKYGETSKNKIEIVPDEGYIITSITINDKEEKYVVEQDGSYTIPVGYFENITENKHIVVTFTEKDKVIYIRKINKEGELLEGAVFEVVGDNQEKYTVTTNENGIGVIGVSNFGTYAIKEIEAPEHYVLSKETQTVTLSSDSSEQTITFENTRKSQIVVHHYLKGTDDKIKVAEDDIVEVGIGERYTTSPHVDLDKITLQKDEEGNYIIPENASGLFDGEGKEVSYYYEAQPIKLTIHHYISGTENKLVDDEIIETKAEVDFDEAEGTYTILANANYLLKENQNYVELSNTYKFENVECSVKSDITIDDNIEYSEDSEIIFTYDVSEYKYEVHYFYNDVEDESKTEKLEGYYQTKIDEYSDKSLGTAVLEKEENFPLIISDNETENIINIYYRISDQYLIINKVDGDGNPVEGAEFTVYTEEPLVIKTKQNDIYSFSPTYKSEFYDEVTDTYTYYSKKNYTSYNANDYGNPKIMHSYFEIDLTNNPLEYILTINAEIFSKKDVNYGYATLTDSTELPLEDELDGQIFKITGNVEAKDYTKLLEGGKKYYLHICYAMNEFGNSQNGMKVNDILIEAIKYISDKSGKATVKVAPGFDGVLRLKETTIPDEYLTEQDLIDYKMKSGEKNEVTVVNYKVSDEKTKTLTINKEDENGKRLKGAKFKIFTDIEENEYVTDENGKIEVILPVDEKIYIKEIEAPEGYELDDNIIETVLKAYKNNEITIVNERKKEVVVHHYLKGTEKEIAETERYEYSEGEHYTTLPHTDLDGLHIIKDENGNDIIPENAEGHFEEEAVDVVYYYEPDEIELVIHHYLEESGEQLAEDEVIELSLDINFDDDGGYNFDTKNVYEILSNEIYKNLVDSGYMLSRVSSSANTRIDIDYKAEINSNSEINYYYTEKTYNILTSEVIPHEEKYKDGTINSNITGGTVEGTPEEIEKGNNSKNTIRIIPDDEYRITRITIITEEDGTEKKVNLDVENILENNTDELITVEGDSISLNEGYFKNVNSDIKIEVEFRKKSSVIVKYLDKDTEEEMATSETLDGYEGKAVETKNKVVQFYKNSDPIITDENKKEIESKVTMTADEQTVIYWYEKVKSGVVVRHIEITEEDIKNGLTLDSGTTLDIEQKTGEIFTTETVTRKIYSEANGIIENEKYKNYISVDGPGGHDEILFIVSKGENSQDIIYPEDIVVEVRFYYIRQYKITTEVASHDEYGYEIKGGTISGDGDDAYEVINKKGSNQKEIVIKPDEGYRVKSITINGATLDISNLEDEEHKIVLGAEYFKEVTEDKYIVVEFEKIIIPATPDVEEKGGEIGEADEIKLENDVEKKIVQENIVRTTSGIKSVPTGDNIYKFIVLMLGSVIIGIGTRFKKGNNE